MEIRSKIWLEINGEPVFGSGRQNLLTAIDKYGSINRAAKEMNISYRKAFSYIQAMEDRLGISLVERKTGGSHGGGATLTGKAKIFLEKYELLEKGLNEFVDKKFGQVFKNIK
ncbi:MAG: LysR family transcriptional regulator [Nitrospiraceae bacterium]|nr:MAG: LysR family transcriptional regulator [Nitrospiraceae bacterium]